MHCTWRCTRKVSATVGQACGVLAGRRVDSQGVAAELMCLRAAEANLTKCVKLSGMLSHLRPAKRH